MESGTFIEPEWLKIAFYSLIAICFLANTFTGFLCVLTKIAMKVFRLKVEVAVYGLGTVVAFLSHTTVSINSSVQSPLAHVIVLLANTLAVFLTRYIWVG